MEHTTPRLETLEEIIKRANPFKVLVVIHFPSRKVIQIPITEIQQYSQDTREYLFRGVM